MWLSTTLPDERTRTGLDTLQRRFIGRPRLHHVDEARRIERAAGHQGPGFFQQFQMLRERFEKRHGADSAEPILSIPEVRFTAVQHPMDVGARAAGSVLHQRMGRVVMVVPQQRQRADQRAGFQPAGGLPKGARQSGIDLGNGQATLPRPGARGGGIFRIKQLEEHVVHKSSVGMQCSGEKGISPWPDHADAGMTRPTLELARPLSRPTLPP